MSSINTPDLKKWEALGLPKAYSFDKDPEGASYLLRSRLIYSIVGFCSSTKKHVSTALRLDEENGLQILKEGRFVSVKRELVPQYSLNKECGCAGGKFEHRVTKQAWTYLGTGEGLLPVNRWTHPKFIPVTKIGREDQERLLQHAFHKDPSLKHDCVVQVVTQMRNIAELNDPKTQPKDVAGTKNPLTRNYHLYKPVHAAMKIIDAEGNVYSTSFGATEEEGLVASGGTNSLNAYNAVPFILDYEESLAHQVRITTSEAISSDQCRQLLAKIEELRKTTARFQYVKQNCHTMVVKLLAQIGIQLNLKLSAIEILFRMAPFSQTMRRAGRCVSRFVDKLPTWVGTALRVIAYLAAFIPKQVFNLALNVGLMIAGSNKGSPLPPSNQTDSKKTEADFERFSCLGWALLGDRMHREMDCSPKLIEWQLNHTGTWVHCYRGPSMGIVPPAEEALRSADEQARETLRNLYEIPLTQPGPLHG